MTRLPFRARLTKRYLASGGRGPSVSRETRLERDSAGVRPGMPRVAVFAHWSTTPTLSLSVRRMLAELQAHDYPVVIVSTCQADVPLDLATALGDRVTVLRRPNSGYDFGSWSVALTRYPAIATAGEVLLLNDSMVGPFDTLGPLLERFHTSPAQMWAVTDSDQLSPHLQSWFLGFRHGSLLEPALRRFWRSIRDERSREEVIWWGELRLSRVASRAGLTLEAAVPHEQVCSPGQNPSLEGWRRLLDHGVPLVKRELLRSPELVPDGASVRPALLDKYDVDVSDWL